MRQAVIVSTARTPIGRAFRGAFNETMPQALAGHAIAQAVTRAGVDPAQLHDVITREMQDEYALRSQQRTAAAQQAGRFDDEIVALASVMSVTDRNTGEKSEKAVTLEKDEGNRPDTNLEGLANLKPVFKDGQRIT